MQIDIVQLWWCH